MNPTLRTKITDKLTKYLNRQPTENEIMNAQTDLHIMGQIREEEISSQQVEIKKQAIEIEKQKLEISALKQ